tara:strand:+ start:96 stop:506 length:411 start_codon:yes stop_codon:yes gene_type:complete
MTSTRITVTHNSKAKAILARYSADIERAVAVSGNMVRNEAVKSIQEHRSSGITRGRHTASTAGNPPNSDTGYLAGNIHLVIDGDKLGCSVESRANYSVALEFGTSSIAARPFLQPALESQSRKIQQVFAKIKTRGT